MSAEIAVIGEGKLADCAARALSDQYEIVRQLNLDAGIPQAKLIVLLQDNWDIDVGLIAEERIQPAGIPWLGAFIAEDEGVIGPLVRPGVPGCSQCADTRRLMAGCDQGQTETETMGIMDEQSSCSSGWFSRAGILQLTLLLADEVERFMQNQRVRTEEGLYIVSMKNLSSSFHFFQPEPLCEICGHLPEDSREAAEITLQMRSGTGAEGYRSRSMKELEAFLVHDYLDERTGILNKKRVNIEAPFADVLVNLPLFGADEVTAGRSHSYAKSELTAILEGLERYCGLKPKGKRTVIHDSFHNLAELALDPVRVGLYSKEQYAQPDFPFEPYDPELPIDWVWGYSFLQERPILVAESLAYYSTGKGDDFVNESSNGCALGGSLEEAVLFAILEVVERDAFLMMWYAQLPVPRLDAFSSGDKQLQLMIERLRAVSGYNLHLYNMTMENGIPSICALAKNSKEQGVNLVCAAGSHPDPVRAAKSAIHELAGMLPYLNQIYETNVEDYKLMYQDSSLVQRMEHHSMLYSLPQAEERLEFLLDKDRPLQSFDDAFPRKTESADPTAELKAVLEIFKRLQLEVIVVDQSTPETLRNGLYCVKVLIPGMLPMTFGHSFVRITGLERVLRIPMELGYAKQPLTLERLNPHPHPFP